MLIRIRPRAAEDQLSAKQTIRGERSRRKAQRLPRDKRRQNSEPFELQPRAMGPMEPMQPTRKAPLAPLKDSGAAGNVAGNAAVEVVTRPQQLEMRRMTRETTLQRRQDSAADELNRPTAES